MSVKVTANELGAVVIPSKNNPEYAFIRLEEKSHAIVNGWVRPIVKSALLLGKTEELREINYKAGQELPGRIQVIETTEVPQGPNPERFMKKSGENGVVLKVDDLPIFRTSVYDATGTSVDTLLQHTNVEEVREYAAAQRAKVQAGGEVNL